VIALVTGGASGIGAEAAARLVARGDTVVLADVDLPAAEATADRLSGTGPGTAHAVALDVTDRAAVQAVVDGVVAAHGRIDLFLNNAGIGTGGLAEELTAEHWDRTLAVNLHGVVHGIEAVYPVMIGQGSGHIVNTASLAGLIPAPMMAPYTTSKWAVVGLTRALRAEAASHGVKVSALCPGFVATPLLDRINDGLRPTSASTTTTGLMQRLQGRAIDVGDVADALMVGIRRNRAIIAVPREARVLALAQRLVPGAVALGVRQAVVRYRAHVSRSEGSVAR
jgi:NAD(P)-dependent dehydrogenase (short-subunit alcohol dehydrogenase family)